MPLSLGGNGVISGIDWAGTGGGLAHITTSTFSAASTVSVNNCFTSTYENYLVTVTCLSSVGAEVGVRMRASSTDDSSANYDFQRNIANGATATLDRTTSQTTGRIGYADTTKVHYAVNVYGPQIAYATLMRSLGALPISGAYLQDVVCRHNVATAYDGFSLIPASGTITGTVRVYGYIND